IFSPGIWASRQSWLNAARSSTTARRTRHSPPRGLDSASLTVWIGAKDLDEVADALELRDGGGDFFVLPMAVTIDEEKIFPGFALAGAGLDFCHVQLAFVKGGESPMEGPHFVGDAQHQAGAV